MLVMLCVMPDLRVDSSLARLDPIPRAPSGPFGTFRHRLNGYLASWVPSPPGEHISIIISASICIIHVCVIYIYIYIYTVSEEHDKSKRFLELPARGRLSMGWPKCPFCWCRYTYIYIHMYICIIL